MCSEPQPNMKISKRFFYSELMLTLGIPTSPWGEKEETATVRRDHWQTFRKIFGCRLTFSACLIVAVFGRRCEPITGVSIYRCMAAQQAYLPVCVCARACMRAHTSVIKKTRMHAEQIFFTCLAFTQWQAAQTDKCARRLNCLPLAGEWDGECGRWLRGGKRILSFRLSRSVRFDSSDSKSIFSEFARFCWVRFGKYAWRQQIRWCSCTAACLSGLLACSLFINSSTRPLTGTPNICMLT